jgi:hypothetical protein
MTSIDIMKFFGNQNPYKSNNLSLWMIYKGFVSYW